MTAERVDRDLYGLRAAFEALNDGDLQKAGEFLDPDVEIGHTPFVDPPASGRSAVLRFMRPAEFENQTLELLSTEMIGGVILADVMFRAVGASSGAEVTQRTFQLFTVRGGSLVRWEVFLDRDEALIAAR